MAEVTPHPVPLAGPLPAAGWYPDPNQPGSLRWWTGEVWGVTSTGMQRPTAPLGRTFLRLGAGLRAGLRFSGLVLAMQSALYLWGLSMIDGAIAAGDASRLDLFDLIDQGLTVVSLLLLVVTGALWSCWQYRLARSAAPQELTHGPGWHAWAWYVPVVSLWFPFQNVRDLWRRRHPHRGQLLLGWWWAGWIAWLAMSRIVDRLYTTSDSVADFKVLVTTALVAAVIGLLALVLAYRIVHALDAAEVAAASAGPGTRRDG